MYSAMIIAENKQVLEYMKGLSSWEKTGNFKVGYTLTDPSKAINILKTEKVDMTLLHLGHDFFDGIELLREIKCKSFCDCVVLFSRDPDYAIMRKALILNAFDFLKYPVSNADLAELIESAICFLIQEKPMNLRVKSEVDKLITVLVTNSAEQEDYLLQTERYANNIFQTVCERENWRPYYIHWRVERVKFYSFIQITNMYPWAANLFIFDDYILTRNPETTMVDIKLNFNHFVRSLALFLRNFKLYDSDNTSFSQICEYILNNSDKNLSLSSVADAFYMNKSYLSHLFKKTKDISFVEFITKVKMERAKYLIRKTDMRIYEVAEYIGFKDTAYFSRLFKKYNHVSPSLY